MKITRKFIDWEATGYKLFQLRSTNANLRRFVCSALRQNTDQCTSPAADCAKCQDMHMDRNISRPELADIFGVSESVINNWERGRSKVSIEDLLFYCQIAQVELDDILVFR